MNNGQASQAKGLIPVSISNTLKLGIHAKIRSVQNWKTGHYQLRHSWVAPSQYQCNRLYPDIWRCLYWICTYIHIGLFYVLQIFFPHLKRGIDWKLTTTHFAMQIDGIVWKNVTGKIVLWACINSTAKIAACYVARKYGNIPWIKPFCSAAPAIFYIF